MTKEYTKSKNTTPSCCSCGEAHTDIYRGYLYYFDIKIIELRYSLKLFSVPSSNIETKNQTQINASMSYANVVENYYTINID